MPEIPSSSIVGRDPLAPFFHRVEEAYDQYQGHTYDENYRNQREGWDRHYGRMQTAFQEALFRFIEQSGKPRSETTLALIAPGLHPAHRDLNPFIVETAIAQLQRVICIDFSMAVNRAAIRSLLGSGVNPRRMFAMQYDLTGGLSTVYDHWLQEKLQPVVREEDLIRLMEGLAKVDIVAELEGHLMEELERVQREFVFPVDQLPTADVPLNHDRTLGIRLEGRQVPLDFATLNMVIAGTGVTAEARWWDTYHNVVATTDSDRGRRPTDAILEGRRRMLALFHGKIVAPYNTQIAINSFHQVLTDNPGASVLAITDVSTNYEDTLLDIGSLPRLHVHEVISKLRDAGINLRDTTPIKDWDWKDQEDHSHTVHALMAKRSQVSSGGA